MTRFKLGWLLNCLFYLQLHSFIRYLNRKKVTILAYHGFSDKKIHGGIENVEGLHLNINKFRSQLGYLKKFYNIIPLDKLIQHYINDTEIPLNSLVITIDDGYKSIYTHAYPILKQLKVPATIFLTTDFLDKKKALWPDRIEYALNMAELNSFQLKIDSDISFFDLSDRQAKKACYEKICYKLKLLPQQLRDPIIENLERSLKQKLCINCSVPEIYSPLEWPEVLEMTKSGLISIGSHGCSHIILTRCNPENLRKELALSKELIEKKMTMSCRFFSYPSGSHGDFDSNTEKALKKTGYSCGLTTIQKINATSPNVFELKRLCVDARGNLTMFIMMLSGITEFLSGIKRFLLKLLPRSYKIP